MGLKSEISSNSAIANVRPSRTNYKSCAIAGSIILAVSTFSIWTIGCQMNVADSRRLAESLEKYGLTAAEGPHAADVVVLYSCVVRQRAEDRVHGQLHALQTDEGGSGPT